VNPAFSERPTRFTLTVLTLAAATALGGCSTIEGLFGGEKVDYRNTAAKTQGLEVPPDLTQLARDSRYQPQGGVVSASGAAAAVPAGAPGATPSSTTVALSNVGDIRVERAGQQRWLVVPQTPEQLWPQLKAFWERRGFTLAVENQQTGVMETNWAENRSKLPADVIRSTIGKLFGNLYDTGERDLYRTRIERTATGSEIYITHRGLEEVYTSERKESTAWRARPGDPQLEAEFLSGVMVALGNKEEPARVAVANAPQQPVKASVAPGGQATTLVIEEPFDRAWRRVGLALDRGGFTVEDRDRAGGLYYVRYIDPKFAGKDEPSWWSKLFGDGTNPQAALRYRILLKSAGDKTNLSVQTTTGTPDTGENAKRIVGLLINDLK
jgi:outer membrane protein assembly factor BamC